MIDWRTEEKEVNQILSQIDHLEKSQDEEKKNLSEAELLLNRTKDAQEILQRLAQAVQQKAHQRIAEVVSACLAAVFDDPYTFHIEFEMFRGKTQAKLRFKRRELDVDPLTASGGGMVDVAAFALRVACLALHRPHLSQVIVVDEPFRFVSAQYQDNVRKMLEGLSKDMKIQIIMVTHNEALETGKVVTL